MADGTDPPTVTREPQPKRPGATKQVHTRTLGQRLREDVPLVILAAALSAFIWFSFRAKVVDVHTATGIRVWADVGDREGRVRAEVESRVDIDFTCSQSDFERIQASLQDRGLRLVIGPDEFLPDDTRPFRRDRGDHYDFDFRAFATEPDNLPFPRGFVTRLELRELPYLDPEPPPELAGRGIELEVVSIDPDRFSDAIPAVRADEIRPDPIRMDQLQIGADEEGLGRTRTVTLSFTQWVEQPVNPDGHPDPNGARDPRRRALDLPNDVTATVRLRRAHEEDIENQLKLALSRAVIEKYRIEVAEPETVNVAGGGQLFATGTIRGTSHELEVLKKYVPEWYWDIRIPVWDQTEVDKLIEQVGYAEVRAVLVLVLNGEHVSGLHEVQFVPTPAQRDELKLRLELRKK